MCQRGKWLTISSRQQDLLGPFDSIDGNNEPIPASHTDISHIEYAIAKLDKASIRNSGMSRKRKRAEIDDKVDEVKLEGQGIAIAAKPLNKQSAIRFESIKLPDLIFPKSAYQGHNPTLPVSSERDVLQDFSVGCL